MFHFLLRIQVTYELRMHPRVGFEAMNAGSAALVVARGVLCVEHQHVFQKDGYLPEPILVFRADKTVDRRKNVHRRAGVFCETSHDHARPHAESLGDLHHGREGDIRQPALDPAEILDVDIGSIRNLTLREMLCLPNVPDSVPQYTEI
jgi:hypothetical protein